MPASAAAPRARFSPIPAITATSSSFGGMIGGVQAGYNVRLSSGILLGAEADITFPNYLTSNSIVVVAGDAAVRSRRAAGLCRNRARPRRLRRRSLAGLCHRRAGMGRRAFRQHAGYRLRGKRTEYPARLGRRGRRRIRLRPALESCGWNISTAGSSRADIRFPSATQYQLAAWISSRSASASIARSTGRDRAISRRRHR